MLVDVPIVVIKNFMAKEEFQPDPSDKHTHVFRNHTDVELFEFISESKAV